VWPAVVAALLALPGVGAAQAELKEYKWKAGKCSILMPGTPKEKDGGKGPGSTSMLLATKEALVFLVSYTEVPDLAGSTKEGIKAALDKFRDSTAAQLKGKLVREKEHKLGSAPGRDFLFEAPGIGLYRARAFVAGGRLYQVVLAGPKDLVQGKDSERFLDSFKLSE
jgi:hypothetical protein